VLDTRGAQGLTARIVGRVVARKRILNDLVARAPPVAAPSASLLDLDLGGPWVGVGGGGSVSCGCLERVRTGGGACLGCIVLSEGAEKNNKMCATRCVPHPTPP